MITVRRAIKSQNTIFFGHLLSIVILLFTPFSTQAGSPVSISSGGTPSYSFPLSVPPGIAGMTPNVGLLYSSSNINGPVGYGWTIQGISMITRCPSNKLIDGATQGVNYSKNDKLCLDGQRLIQTDLNGVVANTGVVNPGLNNPFQQNDSGGGTGIVQEYRTEKDIYARIRSYGMAGGNPANGPAYFKVWTKSGQIYEYGVNSNVTANAQITAQNSAVVIAWPVSRISDTVGNYMDFQYEQRNAVWGSTFDGGNGAGHEWNLLEIRYTGNAGQAPTSKIVFTYNDRPDTPGMAQDRSEAYHQGSKNVSVRLLNSIRTYVNWPANQISQPSTSVKVKTIKLTYDNGPVTNRSRLTNIIECAGVAENLCLPGTTFNYSSGGNSQYVVAPFNLSTLQMQSVTGNYGVLTGNFMGNGRADIVRWSDNSGENQLYQSMGDGSYQLVSLFNITDQNLFKSDSCFGAYAADFNGDGLTDILRIKLSGPSHASCGVAQNILYISNGNGTFRAVDITSTGIDFTQLARNIDYPAYNGDDPVSEQGNNFYFVDVNNDGILDIVTTIYPLMYDGYSVFYDTPACAVQVCTRVFLGKQGGGFTELLNTNLTHHSVFSNLPTWKQHFIFSFIGDVDGDGLPDLLVDTGVWHSRGDGNFDVNSPYPSIPGCVNLIDFNGDGRGDCLLAYGVVSDQGLAVSDGTGAMKRVSNFNLTAPGQELLSIDPSSNNQNAGIQTADIDGDGRADILRWKDDPSQNVIYLSNGDGSFRQDMSFNLTSSDDQLQKSDGSANFVMGDFTGHGNVEILRLVSNPSGVGGINTNRLYVKADSTPPDQLQSVVSSTGLVTTLSWVTLTNSTKDGLGPRYTSDRDTSNAANYPTADLTIPIYVVATTTTDSGVGSQTVTSEYSYAGLKVAYDGRGSLGFRETRRQNIAPDGSPITVWTQFLQLDPYIGLAGITQTWLGTLANPSPQILSTSIYRYCDMTSTADPYATSFQSPCLTSAVVTRPYLFQSTETGNDLVGAQLPTVTTTNVYNNGGDPLQITVQTSGNAAGMTQASSKTTTNQYYSDNTSGDNWLRGRLQRSSVFSAVPNSLPGIPTSAGSAANATGTQGAGNVPALLPLPMDWLTPILMILEQD